MLFVGVEMWENFKGYLEWLGRLFFVYVVRYLIVIENGIWKICRLYVLRIV